MGLVRSPGAPADVGALPPAIGGSGAAPVPAARTPGGPAVAPGVQPERLLIPRLGVAAPVLPVGVGPAASLSVPADPLLVGWWAGGAAAASGTGTVLLAGHVDSAGAGPGALFRLREMRPGDRLVVTGAGRRIAYRVLARRQYPKAQLPWTRLFDQQGPERLVLVSCGGSFSRSSRHYRDNVVVVAAPDVPATAGWSG